MISTAKHAHVRGVGGIGTSAVAQWLVASGWTVSGSDPVASEITAALQGIGVQLIPENDVPETATMLVYSDAVPPSDPVRVAARARGVSEYSYAEMLGELTRGYQTIAVAGSHGKSTTTALAGLILEAAGLDPTVVVGTRVPQWAGRGGARPLKFPCARIGNFRLGQSSIAVVEADEYRRHFLTLAPSVAVVTTVDHDHVDAFPSPAEYESAYREFVSRVVPGGTLVLPAADPAADRLRAHRRPDVRVLTFAVGGGPASASVVASTPQFDGFTQQFRFWIDGTDKGMFTVPLPGLHAIANAAAAVAATLPLGISLDVIRETLSAFRGTWRRFERVGTVNGAPVISDYAHHPTELNALHRAVREQFPDRRVLLAFQPHQRARTRAFAEDFLRVLKDFEVVILAEVYEVAGREEAGDRITTQTWVDPLRAAGRTAVFAPTLVDVDREIRGHAHPGDVILVVGAGDIDAVARRLVSPGESLS